MDWTVLLVGGGAGTGKTTVAPRLAGRFKAGSAQVDDFRMVLQRTLPAAVAPDLDWFLRHAVATQDPDQALHHQLAIGRYMCEALEIVVAHHDSTAHPLVLEGDGLLPDFATRRFYAGHQTGDRIRAVFLFEPNESELLEALARAGRNDASVSDQAVVARFHWLHGEWLRRRAEELGIPTIECRPFDSLESRIVEAARL